VNRLYDLTRPLDLQADLGLSITAEVVVPTLTGFTFLSCLERSPLGEMWKARGPDGEMRIAYYLRVGDGAEVDGRLERLRLFEHPDVLGYDIVDAESGRTILLTETYDQTLQERFQELWSQGQTGIAREELLEYLRSAATALDTVYQGSGFQHLGLTPATLWLKDHGLRVGGFGLIQLLWLPKSPTELNPRYAAPELSRGHVSRRCDQYSLALIFAEMLTGAHPAESLGRRKRPSGRTRKLDLSLLSSADQAVVGRALDPQPARRFASCSEFVQALDDAREAALVDENRVPAALPAIIPAADGSRHLAPASALPSTTLNQFILELVAEAAGHTQLAQSERIRYRVAPGRGMEHRMAVQVFPGALPLKLEGFRQEWKARGVQQEPGRYAFIVTLPPDFWRRLTGKRVGLEIEIQVRASKRSPAQRNEVTVVVRPFGCNPAEATRLLSETGPVILESIRNYLQACPEQRGQDRLAIPQPLRVCPVLPNMQLAQPIECRGKDISTRGIGFFLPHPPSTPQVYINLPGVPQLASVAGLAQIVRGQSCGDGWYEVGAYFAGDGPGNDKPIPLGPET
jgi:Protein kinase domain